MNNPHHLIEYLLDFALPALLFLTGFFLIRSAFIKPRLVCPKCAYDMRAATSLTCTECGYIAENQKQLSGRRIHFLRLVPGILLILPGAFVLGFALLAYPGLAIRESRLNALRSWVSTERQTIMPIEYIHPPHPLACWGMSRALSLWGLNSPQYGLTPENELAASNQRLNQNNIYGFAYARFFIHQTLRPIDHYNRYFPLGANCNRLYFNDQHPINQPLPTPNGDLKTLFQHLDDIEFITFGTTTRITLNLATAQALATLPNLRVVSLGLADNVSPEALQALAASPSIQIFIWNSDPAIFKNFDSRLSALTDFPALTTLNLYSPGYRAPGCSIGFKANTISDQTLAKLLGHPKLRQTTVDCPIVPAQYPLTIAALKSRSLPLRCGIAFILPPDAVPPELQSLANRYGITIRSTPDHALTP